MLSFISSRMGTTRQHSGILPSPTSSTGFTSASAPLPAEVQQWEVQWEHIQVRSQQHALSEQTLWEQSIRRVTRWCAASCCVACQINMLISIVLFCLPVCVCSSSDQSAGAPLERCDTERRTVWCRCRTAPCRQNVYTREAQQMFMLPLFTCRSTWRIGKRRLWQLRF
jgi:hypothetical protein